MDQPAPKGPLAVRWLGLELGEIRAGTLTTASVELENVGSAAWRAEGDRGVRLAYHWLDERGNPIVWDGIRTPVDREVEPGGRLTTDLTIRGPLPPGRYRLALDLVDEGRLWFAEVGNTPLTRELEVAPRIPRALAARGGDPAALAAQEEPLVPEDAAAAVAYLGNGVAPAPDWSRRVLDAHQEGYAVVSGSVEAGRARELEPYRPGTGRVPRFPHPLICPSIVTGVEVDWLDDLAGLPATRPPRAEPWVYDGRIRVRARPRSGRRRG
jgi:hypothetical protein